MRLLKIFLFLLIATNCHAAAFTSTQTGDWNDGGTWGNTSPGVKGTDWPGSAGDTFTVDTGHTVTYNVSETNELGDSTITGKLTFDESADRLLSFGSNILTITSTGELEIGTSGNVFDAAYDAEITWNTSSDNNKGLSINNGGSLTVYGDPAYVSDYEDSLANNAENTDGDTVIKTNSDMSAIWNVGDTIVLKKEIDGDSTSYRDAIVAGVIQSFSGVDITLDVNVTCVAGVGDTWTSPVINVTRNVKFSKESADVASGDGSAHNNTNRPRIYDLNASGNNNTVMSYSIITGFYAIQSTYDFQLLNSTFRNGYYGFNQGTNMTFSGNIYQTNYAFQAVNDLTGSGYLFSNVRGLQGSNTSTFTGDIFSNSYAVYQGDDIDVIGDVYSNQYGATSSLGVNITGDVYWNDYGAYIIGHGSITGNVYSNVYGVYRCNGFKIVGDIYSNSRGIQSGTNTYFSGRMGWNGGVESNNTVRDIEASLGEELVILDNVKMPSAGLVYSNNADGYTINIYSNFDNQTSGAYKIYQNTGVMTKVTFDGTGDYPSEDPDGGTGEGIELGSIGTNCSSYNPVIAWKERSYKVWATASIEKTYTFYVQTTYAGISANNLVLTATYLDEAAGGSTATSTDVDAINERSTDADWTQTKAVTITPAQDGWIYFEIELKEYQASDEVYIWPAVSIS